MTTNTPLRNCAQRTLVVHTGGLGDFLLACPALQALARQGALELLGRPERLELAVAGGIAVAAHDIEGVGFDSLFGTPTAMIMDFLARFDRCIVWMRDDGTLQRAIRSCGVHDVRTFPGLPPEDWRGHASQYYAHALGFDEPANSRKRASERTTVWSPNDNISCQGRRRSLSWHVWLVVFGKEIVWARLKAW